MDIEPVRVLNREECSTNVETGDNEPATVLNSDRCWLRLAASFSEPLNVLKREECSTRIDDKLSEEDKILAKPLISELVRVNEPVRDLCSETCLVVVDATPIEPFNNSTRPLESIVVMPKELLRDLPRPLVSEPAMEMDPPRALAKPFASIPDRVKEQASVLDSIACSTRPEDADRDPVNVLKRPACLPWLDVTVNEPVSVRKIEVCSTKTEDKLKEPDTVLASPLVSDPVRNSEPVNDLNSAA